MTDQRPVRATVYGAPTGGDPLDLADEDGNPIPNPPPNGAWYGPAKKCDICGEVEGLCEWCRQGMEQDT